MERIRLTTRHQVWLGMSLIVLGVVTWIILSISLPNQTNNQGVTSLQIGAPVKDFALIDLQGRTVRLSDYQGQVVLINAWATWCPPCKEEMPVLNAYYLKHRDEGFVALAIDAADPGSAVEAFLKETPVDFPVILDAHLQVMNSFGIHSYPTSVVIGRDGRVKVIRAGAYQPKTLESEVNPLLK